MLFKKKKLIVAYVDAWCKVENHIHVLAYFAHEHGMGRLVNGYKYHRLDQQARFGNQMGIVKINEKTCLNLVYIFIIKEICF